MATYRYSACGTAANGQTWEVSGTFEPASQGGMFESAIHDAFRQLTQGKAVFGHPGVGCQGPYEVTRFLIQKERATDKP